MKVIPPNTETTTDHTTLKPSAVPLSLMMESIKKMAKIVIKKMSTIIFRIIA